MPARRLCSESSVEPGFHRLPRAVADSIRQFMEAMAFRYGRLVSRGQSNGEGGWLDPDGRAGILDKLVDELPADIPCHPLPNPRRITAS